MLIQKEIILNKIEELKIHKSKVFGLTNFLILLGILFLVLILPLESVSQESDREESKDSKSVNLDTGKKLMSVTELIPSLTLVSNYESPSGFWHRSTMFGDLGGIRQKLYEKGITINVQLTQVYQGIAGGGPKNHVGPQYYGLLDYGIAFDTGKLGLWPGGLIVLNAETSYGNSLLGKTGTLSPVNYISLWPEPDAHSTFLMDYYLLQALPHNTLLLIGRINPVEFLDMNKFSNNPRNQFLNISLGNDPFYGSFISFSTYGILTMTQVSEHFGFNLAVADASIQPGDWFGKDSGGFFSTVNTAFDVQFHYKIANLRGDVDLTWLWANNNPTDFTNPRLPVDFAMGNPLPTKKTNNVLGINVQQYLWKPAWASSSDESSTVQTAAYDYQEPGLGVFFRGGWMPPDRNPYNLYLSGGVGGRGVLASRPYDRFGLGVYFLKESGDLDKLEGNLLGNETGFEVFYNVALTPWLNFTVDLQWIDSGIPATDNPVILGTRLNTIF